MFNFQLPLAHPSHLCVGALAHKLTVLRSNLLTEHILFTSVGILQFSYLLLLVDSTVKEPDFNLCKWVSPDNNKSCSEEAKFDQDGLSERKSSNSQLRYRGTSGMFLFFWSLSTGLLLWCCGKLRCCLAINFYSQHLGTCIRSFETTSLESIDVFFLIF